MLNIYHLCTYTNTNILTSLHMWTNLCVYVCVNKGPVRLHIKLITVEEGLTYKETEAIVYMQIITLRNATVKKLDKYAYSGGVAVFL